MPLHRSKSGRRIECCRQRSLMVAAGSSCLALAVAVGACGGGAVSDGPSAAASTPPIPVPDPSDAVAAFGQPRALSAIDGLAGSPRAVVAPTGRTLVIWRTADLEADRYALVASLGPAAGKLGTPKPVRSLARFARGGDAGPLYALADGTFVACAVTNRRREHATVGCTFAPPGEGFGPLRTVLRESWTGRPTFVVTPRPDGTLVFILARNLGGHRVAYSSAIVDAKGTRLATQQLATVDDRSYPQITSTTDGTVAASWSTGGTEADRSPVLRLMAPAVRAFGPPVATGLPPHVQSVLLAGGRSLRLSFGSAGSDGADRVVVRRVDGSFGPPLYLPTAGLQFQSGDTVELADGTPLALVEGENQSETDCGNVTAARVGSGPLTATPKTPAQPLSAKGQIPLLWQAATLADGAVIALIGNSATERGDLRLEAAIRPAGAGAFRSAQVLPQLTGGEAALAAGGDQAIIVWLAGMEADEHAHVMASALRRKPPFSNTATRPVHPKTPCN